MTLDKALDRSRRLLEEAYQKDPQVAELIDIAQRLEGLDPPRLHPRRRGRDRPQAARRSSCRSSRATRRRTSRPSST